MSSEQKNRSTKDRKAFKMAIGIAAGIVLVITVSTMLVVRHAKANVMTCSTKRVTFSGFVITSDNDVMVTFDGDPGLLNLPCVWGYNLFNGGVYSDPSGKGDVFVRMNPVANTAE